MVIMELFSEVFYVSLPVKRMRDAQHSEFPLIFTKTNNLQVDFTN